MNSSINILHIISSAEISGGERYLYDLITNSEKQIRHIVALPYHGPFEKMLHKAGYKYLVIDLQKKFSIKSLIIIISTVKKYNIRIIHSHGYRSNFYARFAGIFTNCKNIATMHVSLFDYLDTPKFIRLIYLFVEKISSILTHKFICISRAMSEDLKRLKINTNKIVLIPNGVDPKIFYPRSINKEKCKDFKLLHNKIVIGSVGRMVSEKGQVYLIEALNHIKNDFPNLQCLFIGDGPKLVSLINKTKELKLKRICKFLGVHEDIENFYSILDIFILPSIREPFGLALIEAMASQIPVIATGGGGPSDFIVSGYNGILVPPKDSKKLAEGIKFLLNNKIVANKMAREGFRTVKDQFSIRNTVKNTCDVYYSL